MNSIPPKKRRIHLADEQDDHPPQVLTENMNTQSPLLSIAGASGSTSPVIEKKRNFDNGDEAYLAKAIIFCNRVRDYLRNDEDKSELMKILYYYSIEETIDKIHMRKMISQLVKDQPKLMKEFDKLIDHYSNPKRFDSEEKKETEEQIKPQPTGEEVTNPSYNRRPASKRKIWEPEVLNDEWILRTPNVMSKEKERNEYEEMMITCENDQYEFDMAYANFRSAFENVKRLITAICQKNVKLEDPIRAKNYLSVRNLRCIEKLYGKRGEEIMDFLDTNPNETLITIFLRLNQKMEDFEKDYKSRLKEQWAKAYADNLHKSMGFE